MHSNEVGTATRKSSCDLENQFVIVGISPANKRSPPGNARDAVWETLVICFSFLCHIIDFTCACLESSKYYRPKAPPTALCSGHILRGQVHFSFVTWFSCRKCCWNELISKILRHTQTNTHTWIYELGKASCIGQKFRLFGFWLNVVDTLPLPSSAHTVVINWLQGRQRQEERGERDLLWPCCFCRLILFIDKPFAGCSFDIISVHTGPANVCAHYTHIQTYINKCKYIYIWIYMNANICCISALNENGSLGQVIPTR